MIDILTAIFSGAMIVVLPMLLLRTLQTIEEKTMLVAWSVLAVLAWAAAGWMVFSTAPLWALLGILLGIAVVWFSRSKPDFRV